MKKSSLTDVIIIGAGHAGLSTSYYLKQHGLAHIVFERGKIGESWHSQRWDSFKLNSPDKLNLLPGDRYQGNDPEGFSSARELVSSYEKYVRFFNLPVVEKTPVISIEKEGELFIVTVSHDKEKEARKYQAKQVVIASGSASEKNIPLLAADITGKIQQLHTSEYCNPSQLAQGAVLVVGSAQSGVQIAEDLANAGRKVYLSTSMVPRVPRKYRGRDIHDWLIDMKFFDMKKEQIADTAMLNMKAPHLTGVGDKARTISLQSLSHKGVIILGKMDKANDKDFFFLANAPMNVKFADGFSARVKGMIEDFITKTDLAAQAPDADLDDSPDTNADCASAITQLNSEEHSIGSIIWATGFVGNFSYIKLPVFDEKGNPKHNNGVTAIEGLYFLGIPWMRHRKSTILFGIKEDAEFISRQVCNYAKGEKPLIAS